MYIYNYIYIIIITIIIISIIIIIYIYYNYIYTLLYIIIHCIYNYMAMFVKSHHIAGPSGGANHLTLPRRSNLSFWHLYETYGRPTGDRTWQGAAPVIPWPRQPRQARHI